MIKAEIKYYLFLFYVMEMLSAPFDGFYRAIELKAISHGKCIIFSS